GDIAFLVDGDVQATETASNGVAIFAYTGPAKVGSDAITATADGGALTSNTLTKTWVAGEPDDVLLTVTPQTQLIGSDVELKALVQDRYGNPVPGANVQFANGGGNLGSAVQTGSSGEVVMPGHTSNVAGDEAITATELKNNNSDTKM